VGERRGEDGRVEEGRGRGEERGRTGGGEEKIEKEKTIRKGRGEWQGKGRRN